jgi:hypothetical protein
MHQKKDVTSHHLAIDPAWLQRIATELFQREQSLPHFPSHALFEVVLQKFLSPSY